MVTAFDFYRTPQIHFGAGKLDLLADMVASFGKSVLLITGKESFVNSPYWDDLIRGLKKQHLQFYHTVVSGEPTVSIVDSVCLRDRDYFIDVVLAIGGGSVLDSGKAISAMFVEEGSVKDYLEGVGTKHPSGVKVPFIAVPTTSGTGSEATKNAVISQVGDNGFKRSLRHNNYVPDLAIIDPRLMLSCPARLTADTGMDAFTQLLEAYLSPKSTFMIDDFAQRGFRCIADYYNRACMNGDSDIEARAGMAYAALVSGIALANAGLGVVHGIAASVGGLFDIPHSVVCGSVMAGANQVTVDHLIKTDKNNPALGKYAAAGRIFLQKNGQSDLFYIDGFMDLLASWREQYKMPRLSSFGVSDKHIDKIVEGTSLKNHPARLSSDQIRKIIAERI